MVKSREEYMGNVRRCLHNAITELLDAQEFAVNAKLEGKNTSLNEDLYELLKLIRNQQDHCLGIMADSGQFPPITQPWGGRKP